MSSAIRHRLSAIESIPSAALELELLRRSIAKRDLTIARWRSAVAVLQNKQTAARKEHKRQLIRLRRSARSVRCVK